MDIEQYKTPYDSSGKVAASKWISYILRPAETGLLCPTAIMTDPRFEQGIADLRAQQIAEFHQTVSPKSLEFWRNRVIPEDDPSMTPKERKSLERQRQQRNRILAQEENVNDTGPIGFVRNTESNAKVHQLVHDLMLTQKFQLTGGVSAGKMFQHQFNKSILEDPDAEQKIIAAMKAVRDCFPPNMPVVLSFHLGKPKKDFMTGRVVRDPATGEVIYDKPHIHGWLYDRVWDFKKCAWGEVHPLTSTVDGNSMLRKMVIDAVLKTTGTVFGDPTKKLDSQRPKRTMFTKREKYWSRHFRGRQEEFLKGEFLNTIKNPYEREAMRQFVEQRRYDVSKNQQNAASNTQKDVRRTELKQLKKGESWKQEFEHVINEFEDTAAFFSSVNAQTKAETAKVTSEPSAPPKQKPAFTPTPDYYKTKRYHAKLTETVVGRYVVFTEDQKRDEMKSIRQSISSIDEQLKADAGLTEQQRTNLEYTRDFELKNLKYLKSQQEQQPIISSKPRPKKL